MKARRSVGSPARSSRNRSPVQTQSRSSRSHGSPAHRVISPASNHRRSLSRSVSPEGSPKRIRRGRGFISNTPLLRDTGHHLLIILQLDYVGMVEEMIVTGSVTIRQLLLFATFQFIVPFDDTFFAICNPLYLFRYSSFRSYHSTSPRR